MVIMMHGMMNGTMHGMMNGSMHGMGWGESIVSLLFTVLVFAVLILTIILYSNICVIKIKFQLKLNFRDIQISNQMNSN